MKKTLTTLLLLTTILAACSKTEAPKMDPKPATANAGAQINSPDLK